MKKRFSASSRAAAMLGCLLISTTACDTDDKQGHVAEDSAISGDTAWQDAHAGDAQPACPAPEALDTWHVTVPCSTPGLTCFGTMWCSIYGHDVEGTCTCQDNGEFYCDYWCEGPDIGPPPPDAQDAQDAQDAPGDTADAPGGCPHPDSLGEDWWNVTCTTPGEVCPGVMWCPIYDDYVDGDCTCTANGTFDCWYWCEGPDIGPPDNSVADVADVADVAEDVGPSE